MQETLDLFSPSNLQTYIDSYAIPWGLNLVLAIVIFVLGKFVVGLLMSLFSKVMAKSKYDNMLTDFVGSILRAILMLFVIVAALDQLGVDTTSLVAIVGAAGLAIGLSLQDSLKNFAAGVMLLVFKPFRTGDYVEAAGIAGSVEAIGIFTSTLTTPDNKAIIVPNGKIYGDNIINYSAKATRRVDMVFGVSYGDDLRKAKAVLHQLLGEDTRILQDPAPTVAVLELGDSSVNIAVRPWVKSADFWGVRFDFVEAVKLRFDQEGLSIPFPQMDVHVKKAD